MKVLIIEDEIPAAENLKEALLQVQPGIQIIARLTSVAESITWLKHHSLPDIIFMDIQLSDGLSFAILETGAIDCPIVFITAYDQYLLKAFDFNSIDYLLKPISIAKLQNTIKKYSALQSHFVNNMPMLLDYVKKNDKSKSRILVRKGQEFQAIRTEDIVYFFTEHKLVFLVDKDNKKYQAEKPNLTELEDELDKKYFYRANRQYIIHVNFIKNFKPFDKSKILVELALPVKEDIIISQENAASFKKWIGEM
jgi:DNA-binding LytR/AlgR family response regulator